MDNFYNGQYIFGTLLFVFEIAANGFSSINESILHSFHGNSQQAHDTFNHQWGLFYPSAYAFSIWQAYNKAIIMNCLKEKKDPPKETYLTAFFISFVIGMNLGIYYHHYFLNEIPSLSFLFSPIFNGLFWGIIFGFAGHLVERFYKKKNGEAYMMRLLVSGFQKLLKSFYTLCFSFHLILKQNLL